MHTRNGSNNRIIVIAQQMKNDVTSILHFFGAIFSPICISWREKKDLLTAGLPSLKITCICKHVPTSCMLKKVGLELLKKCNFLCLGPSKWGGKSKGDGKSDIYVQTALNSSINLMPNEKWLLHLYTNLLEC